MSVDDLIAEARRKNNERDAIDRSGGFAAPGDAGLALHLRTALSAMRYAMNSQDWSAVAEAFCMIQDAEFSVRDDGPKDVLFTG